MASHFRSSLPTKALCLLVMKPKKANPFLTMMTKKTKAGLVEVKATLAMETKVIQLEVRSVLHAQGTPLTT